MESNDLANLSEAFRRDATGPRLPSGEEIARLSRRGTIQEGWKLAKEVLSMAFAAVVLLTLMVKQPSVYLAIISSVILAALVVSLGYRLHVREGMWKAAGTSLREYARLDVARKRADLRLARFQRVLFVVLVGAFCVWLPFYLQTHTTRFVVEPWRLPVLLTVAFGVFGVTAWHAQRAIGRARRELARTLTVFGGLAEDSKPSEDG